MCRDRFLSLVVAPSLLHVDVAVYAVNGDFPAMEWERATRGTNRGSPRGIPRKTRSHQDSWMLALCCTDLTYWPLQLPCTINRDPARGACIRKERERKKNEERCKADGGKGEEMWLVTLQRVGRSSSFSFSFCSTFGFRGRFSLSVSSFRPGLSSVRERPTIVEMGNRLGLRRERNVGEIHAAISRRRTHYEHLMSCALPKTADVYKRAACAGCAPEFDLLINDLRGFFFFFLTNIWDSSVT
jgi:hypothetical protein